MIKLGASSYPARRMPAGHLAPAASALRRQAGGCVSGGAQPESTLLDSRGIV